MAVDIPDLARLARGGVGGGNVPLPQEAHAGGLISTPYRYRWAETMRDFHRARAEEMYRALFPPQPMDAEDFMRMVRKSEGHK